MTLGVVLKPLAVIGLMLCAVQLSALDEERIDELVQIFDPYQNVSVSNGFTEPASDIAEDVQDAAWFSGLVFLPFLIIPQILLLVVIFKFRDRKDGRKPATFIHNNALEITWTAIPVVALIIVSIPLTVLLYKTDLPAPDLKRGDPLAVNVYGKQFSWVFEYPEHDISLALENGYQLPIVLVKDRIASLNIASYDVNHAWAVPAFGVKKDAFPLPRWNYTWFTPTRFNHGTHGYYEGQCYELCGADHGKMVFGAVVVEQVVFDRWVRFMHDKADTEAVIDALLALDAETDAESETSLEEALTAYFALDRSEERQDSLRFWTAYRYWTEKQVMAMQGSGDPERHWKLAAEQRGVLAGRMQQVIAQLPSVSEMEGRQAEAETESDDGESTDEPGADDAEDADADGDGEEN